jgi:N-acetyl-anhydromuramyl-L-alanine amidase AmpD
MEILKSNLTFKGAIPPRKETKFIILHHAMANKCGPEDIHRWHLANGWLGAGYHFLVRKDGKVYELRPLTAEGAHAVGYNEIAIGICFEGNFDVETMPEVQFKAGVELLQYILKVYPAQILCHKEVNSTNCPGKNFRYDMKDKAKNIQVVDEAYNLNVDLMAKALGLNAPDYWKNYSDPSVRRLIALMADFIRAQGGV